jgi:hypothetical protein
MKVSDKKSLMTYFIIDKSREKFLMRWNYPYRNSPTVKLKITYNGGGLSNTLFGKKERPRRVGGPGTIEAMYASIQYYQNPISDAMAKGRDRIPEEQWQDNLPPNYLVREVYYALRKSFLEIYYKGSSDNANLYGSEEICQQGWKEDQYAERRRGEDEQTFVGGSTHKNLCSGKNKY